MKYRPFGRTGLTVSELAFGCGQVGGLIINGPDEDRRRAVRTALEGGINWFDTAAQYGDGKSEERLGEVLEALGAADKVHVSTKFRVDPAAGDFEAQIRGSVEASLDRLRRRAVDLLQLHVQIDDAGPARHLTVDQVLGAGGVADGMERVRARGLTRHIGITALGETKDVCRVIASGRFDAAQVYYNLLNPSAARPMPPGWTGHDLGGILAACRAQGMAVMAIRVFAGGVATAKKVESLFMMTRGTELAEEERRAAAAFAALGVAPQARAATALRFALSNPDLACAIVGIGEPGHLDQALAAEAEGPLAEPAFKALERLYESDFGRT